MEVDDKIVDLKEWDAVRVPPGMWRGYEAGPEGPRNSRHRRTQPRRGSARRRRWQARLVGRLAAGEERRSERADDFSVACQSPPVRIRTA